MQYNQPSFKRSIFKHNTIRLKLPLWDTFLMPVLIEIHLLLFRLPLTPPTRWKPITITVFQQIYKQTKQSGHANEMAGASSTGDSSSRPASPRTTPWCRRKRTSTVGGYHVTWKCKFFPYSHRSLELSLILVYKVMLASVQRRILKRLAPSQGAVVELAFGQFLKRVHHWRWPQPSSARGFATIPCVFSPGGLGYQLKVGVSCSYRPMVLGNS